MLMRRGHGLGGMLAALRYIVVERIARVYGNRTWVSSFSRSCIVSSRLLADGFADRPIRDSREPWMEPRTFCPDGSCQWSWSIAARQPDSQSACERSPRQRKGETKQGRVGWPSQLSIAESLYKELRAQAISSSQTAEQMWSSTPISCGSPARTMVCRMNSGPTMEPVPGDPRGN